MTSQLIAAQMVGGREKQEDDFAVLDLSGRDRGSLVFVVADGMGGHSGAADAAKLATAAFCDGMRNAVGQQLPLRLSAALHQANAAIAAAGNADKKIRGAGCTLVAAVIEDNAVSWISVGDSSLYLFRRDTVRRLNERHLAAPTGSPRAKSRFKVLRSSLSGGKLAAIDVSPQPIQLMRDDCIIVASDGLDCIGERRLASILRRSMRRRPNEVVERLLGVVKARPIAAQDNTTIIFYRVGGESHVRVHPGHPGIGSRPILKLAVMGILSAAIAFAVTHGLLR